MLLTLRSSDTFGNFKGPLPEEVSYIVMTCIVDREIVVTSFRGLKPGNPFMVVKK